jgi:single-strand DNA-binding protein
MAFNKVILIGNLTEDPELKTTPSGVPVTSFRIAVSRRFKKDGEQDADFINIVCWRATAEFVAKYFTKGRAILVCGQLKSRNWTDNDGNKRYALDVEADEVSFVDRKPTEAQATDSPTLTPPPYASGSELVEYSDDSDLPF